MSDVQRSTLGRRWLLKTGIFALFLLVLGVWGALDAWVIYPNRGARHAEWAKWKYLDAVARAGVLSVDASVADPVAEYARLQSSEVLSANTRDLGSTSIRQPQAALEMARLTWLRSLDRIGRLKPEFTVIAEPRRVLEDLTTEWAPKPVPKSLSRWDIPVQYVFVIVGLGGGVYLLVQILRVRSRVYTWDPSRLCLTLPGGGAITPEDLAEVDKRKWEKFLVYLKINPAHSTLGGREIRIDLYHHHPVEEWVLAMERQAFPESAGAVDANSSDESPRESQGTNSKPVEASDDGAAGGGDGGGRD